MNEHSPGNGKTILIASNSIDESCWQPVAEKLIGRGHEVFIYEADKVSDGSVSLDISVSSNQGLTVRYDGSPLNLELMDAAWYRRPTVFAGEQADKARQLSLDTERKMVQYTLWDYVRKDAWLNEPQKIMHAEHKLTQLVVAKEVGFNIPDTVVSNNWPFVMDTLPTQIIFKPSYGMLYGDNKLKMVYTSPFDNDKKALPTNSNPFPGFWQPYLSKFREWRITMVGDTSFDAAIYTDNDAKDDWRRHQLETKVRFERGTFPHKEKEKCAEYLGKMGLRFGAFDFIENDQGQISFLECNANGQYGWLEDELNFPISTAIADELVKIAKA